MARRFNNYNKMQVAWARHEAFLASQANNAVASFDLFSAFQAQNGAVNAYTISLGFLSLTFSQATPIANSPPIRVGLGIFNQSATGVAELPDPGDEGQAYGWWYWWSLTPPSTEDVSLTHNLLIKTQRRVKSFEQPMLVVTQNTGGTIEVSTSSRWMVKY